MRTVSFTVHGEPQGKGRPRFSKRGGFVQTYTPTKTKSYEELVAAEYIKQCGNITADRNNCIHMEILACFGIPKSTSKVNRLRMLMNLIRPLKKPDIDNILKLLPTHSTASLTKMTSKSHVFLLKKSTPTHHASK